MATTNQSDSPSLNTINNLFGTSLEFPKCFRTPGTASLQTAFTGSGWPGSITGSGSNHNPGPTTPISSLMNGIAQDFGLRNITGALTVTGQTLFIGGFKGETAYWSLNSGSWSITSGGGASITASEDIKITSAGKLNLCSSSIFIDGELYQAKKMYWDRKKDFDIPHPTKEGWRLRHVSIEGPTADVYVKGKLENCNVIELPDYWVGLVDLETITVTLTPIGAYQELFVEKIENNQVFIENNSAGMIKCYYLICGERKDTEKNIPEYKGTYDDYPGDNTQYSGSLMNILRGL